MDNLKHFSTLELNSILKKRNKETKLGEHVVLLSDVNTIYEQLSKLDVTYVIFGIKEDVGVFANFGKTGTHKAWDATIKTLLNVQSNAHTHAKQIAILGCLEFQKYEDQVSQLDPMRKKDVVKARKKVEKIDETVSFLVSQIVSAGKIPIIIGGGHNNAYGNIKGTALGLKKSINAINFDAHHDFRAAEGRHSGNGFSYAYTEGFLKSYFIFGLHENYTSDKVFQSLKKLKNIQYNTFESMIIRKEYSFENEMDIALDHIGSRYFGLEIDCDAIQDIPSSAMTPSGFTVNKTRAFVNFFGKQKKASYLHVCEASPTPSTEIQVGKLITYLITDFIRAHENN